MDNLFATDGTLFEKNKTQITVLLLINCDSSSNISGTKEILRTYPSDDVMDIWNVASLTL